MNNNITLFKELILNSNLTAEEIYNKILDSRKKDLCTKKIYRNITSWNNSIYQGAIGENDFLISEADSSSIGERKYFNEI